MCSIQNECRPTIGALGGIELIKRAMEEFEDKADIQNYGCGALWHLSRNDLNRLKIVDFGVRLIINALENFPNHRNIREHACYALIELYKNNEEAFDSAELDNIRNIISAYSEPKIKKVAAKLLKMLNKVRS
jgi:hypothetical protein